MKSNCKFVRCSLYFENGLCVNIYIHTHIHYVYVCMYEYIHIYIYLYTIFLSLYKQSLCEHEYSFSNSIVSNSFFIS